MFGGGCGCVWGRGGRASAATAKPAARHHYGPFCTSLALFSLSLPHHTRLIPRLSSPSQIVFGPASDGGFYLVAATRAPPVLFAPGTVRWSGPHALADAIASARAAGLCVQGGGVGGSEGGVSADHAPAPPLPALRTLRDWDTRADLEAWRASAGDGHPLAAAADRALQASVRP